MALTRDYSHYVKELDAGVAHLDLAVEGVSCAGCMAKIERGLSAIPDVTRARVNLTDRRLAVEWRKGAVDPAALIDRLAELGYRAYPFEPVRAELVEAEQSRFLLRCLGVAAFAAMNVMMLSIPVWSGNVSDMLPEQRAFFHWMSARCSGSMSETLPDHTGIDSIITFMAAKAATPRQRSRKRDCSASTSSARTGSNG